MSEIKTNKISSLASNNDITIDPDGTGLFLPNRTPTFFAELSSDQTISDATDTNTTSRQEKISETIISFIEQDNQTESTIFI